MLKEERHLKIMNEVVLHNRILLNDLAETLDVSIDTVRRDVKQLDSENKLRKVHGGALSLGFAVYSPKHDNIYAQPEKMKIAEKAIKFLKNENVILIHGGTTCLELARLIPPKLNLTCFTLSLPIAMELVKKPNIKIIFVGGQLYKDTKITIGAKAIRTLSEIKVDYSFIGTGYVDSSYGLTEFDWDSVQVKKAVVKASKKTILMCISEKLNSIHRYKTCDLMDINTMITELNPDDETLNNFRKNDLNLL